MFGSAIVIAGFLIALAGSVGSDGRALITPTPYNNRYSDAPGARDDWYA